MNCVCIYVGSINWLVDCQRKTWDQEGHVGRIGEELLGEGGS